MHKYEWDPETGGLLLSPQQEKSSKEPRPANIFSYVADLRQSCYNWERGIQRLRSRKGSCNVRQKHRI